MLYITIVKVQATFSIDKVARFGSNKKGLISLIVVKYLDIPKLTPIFPIILRGLREVKDMLGVEFTAITRVVAHEHEHEIGPWLLSLFHIIKTFRKYNFDLKNKTNICS